MEDPMADWLDDAVKKNIAEKLAAAEKQRVTKEQDARVDHIFEQKEAAYWRSLTDGLKADVAAVNEKYRAAGFDDQLKFELPNDDNVGLKTLKQPVQMVRLLHQRRKITFAFGEGRDREAVCPMVINGDDIVLDVRGGITGSGTVEDVRQFIITSLIGKL
jgi:hypothetical protein